MDTTTATAGSSPAPEHGVGNDDLPGRFRRVYHDLYANSNASRAEVLLADLSLLLLTKLLAEVEPDAGVERFVAGEATAASLLPALRRAFPRIVDEGDKFHVDDASLRRALMGLGEVRLSQSPAHVLGEAFQALLGPRIRGDKGQFFTPRTLVRAMVAIVAPAPGEAILDPACGTGGFLHEALAHVRAQGGEPAAIHGADKDRELSRLAAAMLAFQTRVGWVEHLNSLHSPAWAKSGLLDAYDVILTNPPFGTKIPVRDPEILREYELARQWRYSEAARRWQPTAAPEAGQDPQILFLELCIRRLRPGGRMAIVLPEGVFGNRQEAYVWDWVRAQGEIVALLDCPRTTFQPGTDTKTNVLFFRKGAAGRPAKVAVAVALQCGHDRRGRTTRADGSPYP
ncbi:MAG TPA: N-6 DNA methylase, partial [Nannocystis sp.]